MPASRNARPTARGSTACALAATSAITTAAWRHARTLRRIEHLERALDEESEFVIGQRIGRHEVDGAADRAQHELAAQCLRRESLRESVARRIDVEREDHPALPEAAHARMRNNRRREAAPALRPAAIDGDD